MILSNSAYDKAKWLVQVFLPALGAAYFALGNIWGLPATEAVVGTSAILATFIGTLVGISSRAYNAAGHQYDGEVDVVEDPGGMKTVNLVLNGDPEQILLNQDRLLFRVVKNTESE